MWFNVDIRNETRDTSFVLKSSQKENFPFTICPVNKDLIVIEKFRKDFVTLRQLKQIKYTGGYQCWQSFLNFDDMASLNKDLISKLEIIVSNETYYTDCNVAGVFQTKNEKNTFKINTNIDFAKLSHSQCEEIIQGMWQISEKLKNIVI